MGVWGADPCWAGLSPSWQQLRQACSRPRPTVTSCSHRETHCILCHPLACQGAIRVLILPTDPRHPLCNFSLRHSKHPAAGTSSIRRVSLVTFTLEHSSSLKKKKIFYSIVFLKNNFLLRFEQNCSHLRLAAFLAGEPHEQCCVHCRCAVATGPSLTTPIRRHLVPHSRVPLQASQVAQW